MSHQPKVTNFFVSTKRGQSLRNLKGKAHSVTRKNDEEIGFVDKRNYLAKNEPAISGTKTSTENTLEANWDLSLLDFKKSTETPKRKRHESSNLQSNKRKKNSLDLSSESETMKPSCLIETPPSALGKKKNGRLLLSVAKKKLDMKEAKHEEIASIEDSVTQKLNSKENGIEKDGNAEKECRHNILSTSVKSQENDKSSFENLIQKADITKLLSAHYAAPKPISPLPPSPQRKKSPEVSTKTSLKDMTSTQMAQIISKKLTNADVKAKLENCSKLAQLKQQLVSIAKLKERKQNAPNPELKKFTSIEIADSEVTRAKNVPAYQRYHNLATVATPTLSLAYKYKLLEEFFRSVDSILGLLHNRQETCTFSKLKPAVQQLIRRTFETSHLGQIKQVFPEAYEFKLETGNSKYLQNSNHSGSQLTISPNFNYKSIDKTTEERVPNIEVNTFQSLTPSVLLERQNIFHNKLVELMKVHHSKFLASLDPPMTLPDYKLKRWHPQFNVDSVPDVEPALLPEPKNVLLYNTAKDVLQRTRGLYGKRVELALENAANKFTVHKEENVNNSPKSIVKSLHNGIPQTLLDKIRAKEAAKIQLEMTRDPAQDKHDRMVARLPDIIRIMRNYFISEKKAALVLEDVIQKLGESFRTALSSDEIEAHVQLLARLFPEWLSIINLKRGVFLKIDKNTDINSIVNRLKVK